LLGRDLSGETAGKYETEIKEKLPMTLFSDMDIFYNGEFPTMNFGGDRKIYGRTPSK